jgi:hypothetical protein
MFFQTINNFYSIPQPFPLYLGQRHRVGQPSPYEDAFFQHPHFLRRFGREPLMEFQMGNPWMDAFFSGGGNPPPPAAAKHVVESLQEQEVQGSEVVCTVCQEEFNASEKAINEKAIKLPCHHYFHKECIIPWLKDHNTCPTCRFELPTENSDYDEQLEARMQQRSVTSRIPVSSSEANALPAREPSQAQYQPRFRATEAAAVHSSPQLQQQEGSESAVRVMGLQARPQLNGRVGRIAGRAVPDSLNPAVIRYPVQLPGEPALLLLRPENLARARVVARSAPHSPPYQTVCPMDDDAMEC